MLVSEVFSEIIVQKAICGRASEAWTIWEGVSKIISILRPNATRLQPANLAPSPINKLHEFGLLSPSDTPRGEDLQHAQPGRLQSITQFFWSTLQLTFMVSLILRSLVSALMHASSVPARPNPRRISKASDRLPVSAVDAASLPRTEELEPQGHEKRPVVSLAVWTCISRLSSLQLRMPWLSGFLSLLQWVCLYGPGQVCSTNSALDR